MAGDGTNKSTMRIEITMWGPNQTWKGLVLPHMYGIRGRIGSTDALARRYKDGKENVLVDITNAVFLPTRQPSGRAYRPEDNEYDPTGGGQWPRVK